MHCLHSATPQAATELGICGIASSGARRPENTSLQLARDEAQECHPPWHHAKAGGVDRLADIDLGLHDHAGVLQGVQDSHEPIAVEDVEEQEAAAWSQHHASRPDEVPDVGEHGGRLYAKYDVEGFGGISLSDVHGVHELELEVVQRGMLVATVDVLLGIVRCHVATGLCDFRQVASAAPSHASHLQDIFVVEQLGVRLWCAGPSRHVPIGCSSVHLHPPFSRTGLDRLPGEKLRPRQLHPEFHATIADVNHGRISLSAEALICPMYEASPRSSGFDC
mmetsp:Transcript_53796/g.156348  ORF Transcript_53796/g.156348 Transcript_53796/m.156348 type:complete len:278 (+) Transcript_53796:72-905(+)